MAKPIYKLYLARYTEAAYQASPEQRAEALARHNEIQEKLGIKTILMCDSSWANQQYTFWGIQEFPDIEALYAFHAALHEMDWFRYTEAFTLLGTPLEQG